MFEQQLDLFKGKTVKSMHMDALRVDGRGPVSILIRFMDGSTLSTVIDGRQVDGALANGDSFTLYTDNCRVPFKA
jgi:hypothetical protein